MVMNIVYSTVVACLVEVFLIANVSMISSYLRETRYRDSFFLRLTETETLMAFVYLLTGNESANINQGSFRKSFPEL